MSAGVKVGGNAVPRPAISVIWRSQAFFMGTHVPCRKGTFIHGNATGESEFGQANGLTTNTVGPLQNRKGPQIFTGGPWIF